MSQYCPPYRSSSNNIKVELDLANYATKADLNNITHVDVSSFASKTNLAALKTEVDKIDADKLKTTPADLAKLTNAVEHDVVKKTDYNTKVTSIYNYSSDSSMNAVVNAKSTLPNFKNDGRMHVHLSGNHFQQNVAGIPNNGDVINIYCVYKLDPIPSSRDTSFTIQGALFGAMQITKNATDNSKNNYKGYGRCFDKGSQIGDQWTASESEKTGLYGNIYDFVVDYEQILGVKPIYDMHRYLMTKHNISL